MTVDLMELTPPEELIRLMDIQNNLMGEMYRIIGIKPMIMAFPEPGERSIWR